MNRARDRAVQRWIGIVLAGQWCLVLCIKCVQGAPYDMLWVSHVGLALAAVGLLLGSSFWMSCAVVGLLVPHALWLVDALYLTLRGASPTGWTAYLADADLLTWLATLHHFYLVPLLLLLVGRGSYWRRRAVPAWIAIFYALTLFGALMPAAANVNFAHGFLGAIESPVFDWINRLPVGWYLLVLNLGAVVFSVAPAAIVLDWLGADRRSCVGCQRSGMKAKRS